MAASPVAMDGVPPQENWGPSDDQGMGPAGGDTEASNGGPNPVDDRLTSDDAQNSGYPRGSSVGDVSLSGSKNDAGYREKQVKPNKVYVGGLPEGARQEDLQTCFGKIGSIVNIELKVGYGFVEFDTREAAEESVAKYHEGYFMGNKIRVELSHGGGRTAKYSGDPGACFKCGQMGHWARECPNHTSGSRRSNRPSDASLIDRIQPTRDYLPPPRDFPFRDDFAPGRYPPPRDPRYGYDYPPPPPGRDFRRPISPPRDYRDYPVGPPRRDYDDYRMRGPPPPPPPMHRYDSRPGYYPDGEAPPPGYPPRGYGPPPPLPPRDPYDRYDRRPPPGDRYPPYGPPPPGLRARTPPGGPPPRGRDDFERPLRDYPPPPEFRGRPGSPPSRYAPDYPGRPGSPGGNVQRYRRRSGSPPPRSSAPDAPPPYDPTYPSGGPNGGFPGNGYSGAPPSSVPPPRSGGSREYPARNGRDAADPASGYRRA